MEVILEYKNLIDKTEIKEQLHKILSDYINRTKGMLDTKPSVIAEGGNNESNSTI